MNHQPVLNRQPLVVLWVIVTICLSLWSIANTLLTRRPEVPTHQRPRPVLSRYDACLLDHSQDYCVGREVGYGEGTRDQRAVTLQDVQTGIRLNDAVTRGRAILPDVREER